MNRGIAFFDFDGTITTKDSLLEFIRFTHGKRKFLSGFLKHVHYILAFKTKFIGNQYFKEKMLQYFYKGIPVTSFKKQCSHFAIEILPGLIRPKALVEIKKLQEQGIHVVVVSASAEEYICDWAEPLGMQVIATRLEVKDGMITGKLNGLNCHGEEKVRRILELYKMEDYEKIYAYGDTSGDIPMMKLARSTYYKPFRK
ncbi:MAG: HAD family hydrolase [Flavisolibacter sp.]